MIGFKTIGELSFDDCVKIIALHQSESTAIDAELLARHNQLLSQQQERVRVLQEQEERDFSCCNTLKSLKRFIKKYTSLDGVDHYSPQYIQQATDKILQLKKKRKKKWIITIKIFSIIAVIATIAITISIGYRPVTHLLPSETIVKFSKNPETKHVQILTDALYYNVEVSRPCSWLSAIKDWENKNCISITVTKNEGDAHIGTIVVATYPTFFGHQIDFLRKECRITVEQETGHTTYLNVSKTNVILNSEGRAMSLPVSTDGFEWDIETDMSSDWLYVSKSDSYINIRASENPYPHSRSASFAVYSDTVRKDISVSQGAKDYVSEAQNISPSKSAYKPDCKITNVAWRKFNSNENLPIKIEYYTQGLKEQGLYVVMKILDEDRNVFLTKYAPLKVSQRKTNSKQIFIVSPSERRGKHGKCTVDVCISLDHNGNIGLGHFRKQIKL